MTTDEITRWIQAQYPNPKLDPDWVNACVEFLLKELQLDPKLHFDDLARHTLTQMLESDLGDSMLHETGFPAGIRSLKNGVIGTRATGGPILVQVASITEIGASAFTLANVRQSRLDKADMTGLTKEKDPDNDGDAKEAERDQDEEDVTMPSYPRSMISLMIDDGTTKIKAIEYKRLPNLLLGETPLGCKILLRGVRVRNGIAMLEPETAEVVGHQNDDMQANADMDFLRSLRRRMQKPEEDPDDERVIRHQQEQAQPSQHADPPPPLLAAQEAPLTQARRKPEPARPESPYFQSSSSPEPEGAPATNSNHSIDFNDSFAMDDIEMDDQFLQEIEEAEKRILNGSQSATAPSVPSTDGNLPPKTSKSASRNANAEIIELDDSDEEPPSWPPPRRAAHAIIDTIDLSD